MKPLHPIFVVLAFLFLEHHLYSCQAGWLQTIADQTPGSPTARYYHTSTFNPRDGSLYALAGVIFQNSITTSVNDLWRINLTSSTIWEKVSTTGAISPRGYHSAAIASDGKWLIFGGKTEEQPVDTYYNDLWSYDFTTSTWTMLIASGDKKSPRKRYWHSTVVDQTGNLFLFGGYGIDTMVPGYGPMNDLWMWNATSGWTMLIDNGTMGSPPPRQGHSAVLADSGEMLVFGGQALLGGMNDLWSFSFSSKKWTQIPAGAGPLPRSGQASVLSAGRLWIFGGSYIPDGMPEVYHNDMWYYSLTTKAWVQVQPDSSAPSENQPWKRKADSIALWGAQFYMFGGYGLFQGLKNDLWRYNPASTSPEVKRHALRVN